MVTSRAEQAKAARESDEMRSVAGDDAGDGRRDGLGLGFLPGEAGDDEGSLRNVLFGPSLHRTTIFIVTCAWVIYFFAATTPAYASLGPVGEDVRSYIEFAIALFYFWDFCLRCYYEMYERKEIFGYLLSVECVVVDIGSFAFTFASILCSKDPGDWPLWVLRVLVVCSKAGACIG